MSLLVGECGKTEPQVLGMTGAVQFWFSISWLKFIGSITVLNYIFETSSFVLGSCLMTSVGCELGDRELTQPHTPVKRKKKKKKIDV